MPTSRGSFSPDKNKISNSVGFWPRTDKDTGAPKDGMVSGKLTAEQVNVLRSLKEGDRLMIFENTQQNETKTRPHLNLLVPKANPNASTTPRVSSKDDF